MKTIHWLLVLALALLAPGTLRADETITVSATTTDISENLDLKTVATLFGQADDLEEFEQMINNPDSAFSNLDLNGDGEVDYLRVIETADGSRHLVVIQAVLAKDIYQDVASIFVEKDEKTSEVSVQVVGDEYIYGANYIIEPVYLYRPHIYDWFWGASWVAWHSPYYWGYWPGWWRPYYCIDPFLYWDHCYWHHYHYPICSYRMAHHHHPHYAPMREPLRRNDYAQRHPNGSFASRNATRNISNASALEQGRRSVMREATATRTTAPTTRVSASSTRSAQPTRNATYGSTNVRSAATGTTTRTSAGTRSTVSSTRSTATRSAAGTATRSAATAATRSSQTSTTRSAASTATRGSQTSVTRSAASTATRSASPSVRSVSSSTRSSGATAVPRSSSSSVRSSSSVSRPTSMPSSGSSMRTSGGSSTSRTSSSGSRR